MKRSRYTEEQIIGILKEHQAGLPAHDLCRKTRPVVAGRIARDTSLHLEMGSIFAIPVY